MKDYGERLTDLTIDDINHASKDDLRRFEIDLRWELGNCVRDESRTVGDVVNNVQARIHTIHIESLLEWTKERARRLVDKK